MINFDIYIYNIEVYASESTHIFHGANHTRKKPIKLRAVTFEAYSLYASKNRSDGEELEKKRYSWWRGNSKL